MKLEFFNRSAGDQAVIIREVAARRGVSAVMVEKDFWVSWTLAVLFAHPEFGEQLVFKGGTSLSKVFGVIERFSEDIDLSVSPEFVGIKEKWVDEAESRNKRTERMKELEAACIETVRERTRQRCAHVAIRRFGKCFLGIPIFEIAVYRKSPRGLLRSGCFHTCRDLRLV